MRDLTDDLAALRRRLVEAQGYLRIDELRRARPQLEVEASRPDLWDDPDLARKVNGELAAANEDLDLWDALAGASTMPRRSTSWPARRPTTRCRPNWTSRWSSLAAAFDELELRSLFTGEHDEADAICEIQSGEGGADAQDWANMLLRMDLRWAEQRGFDVELDEVSPGSEAGISSATFLVRGRHAYGRLRSEHGVHRLVPHLPVQRPGQAPDRLRRAQGHARSWRTCPTSRSTRRRTCASTSTAPRGPGAST